ncbi:MAG: urea ABC transporter permease subunit UrtB, partial [Cypionkella sp.]
MRLTACLAAALFWLIPTLACAQSTAAEIIAQNRAQIEKPSRQTIGPVIAALAASGDAMADDILQAWAEKRLVIRKADGALFLAQPDGADFALTALDGSPAGPAAKPELTELKPNAGVRGVIAAALVQVNLSDPDPTRRAAALTSIARDPTAETLAPLRASIDTESDPVLKAQKLRLDRFLTLRFDPDPAARVDAIHALGRDTALDVRAALTPLVATRQIAAANPPPGNIARTLRLGRDLSDTAAYDLLVDAALAPQRLTLEDQRAALLANVSNGAVAGIPLSDLNTQAARDMAYTALEMAGKVPAAATDDEVRAALASHGFYEVYQESDPAVTSAAVAALSQINSKVAVMQAADLGLDALSLA